MKDLPARKREVTGPLDCARGERLGCAAWRATIFRKGRGTRPHPRCLTLRVRNDGGRERPAASRQAGIPLQGFLSLPASPTGRSCGLLRHPAFFPACRDRLPVQPLLSGVQPFSNVAGSPLVRVKSFRASNLSAMLLACPRGLLSHSPRGGWLFNFPPPDAPQSPVHEGLRAVLVRSCPACRNVAPSFGASPCLPSRTH